jgi:RNAse (barnase) inhibitor barstar
VHALIVLQKLKHPYTNFDEHPFWRPIEAALGDLAANRDVSISTDMRYVVGYLLSKLARNRAIVVDWAKCLSLDEFYDMILPQCGSPAWHGRNLDALNDSWVTGDIDDGGPPFAFWFLNGSKTPAALLEFRTAVEDLAAESITENGGEIHKAEQAAP